jgi:hypothetical protein
VPFVIVVVLTHPSLFPIPWKGYQIEVFSPSGGKCEPDRRSDPRHPSGYSAGDLISMGFIPTPKLAALAKNTKKVRKLKVEDVGAIFVADGQGPMFTYEKSGTCKPYGGICNIHWPKSMSLSYWQSGAWKWMPVD